MVFQPVFWRVSEARPLADGEEAAEPRVPCEGRKGRTGPSAARDLLWSPQRTGREQQVCTELGKSSQQRESSHRDLEQKHAWALEQLREAVPQKGQCEGRGRVRLLGEGQP